jgi:putative phage-type endonuclease
MSVEHSSNRNIGLGASDAPAVLGLSPWRTPLEVFLEKTGRAAPQNENLAMRIGRALEPVVLSVFSEETGLSVTRQQERIRCPRYAWRWATVDAIASDGALVEAKTASCAAEWGEPDTDQIPRHYIVQVQHALACTGLTLAYVPVLIAARDFRIYRVERDESIIEAITEREAEFWSRIERDDPPPPTSPVDVRLRWPSDNGASVIAEPADVETITRLRELMRELKSLEKEVEQLEYRIKLRMGEASQLVDADGRVLVTWKAIKPVLRFDTEAFKLAHPELYAAFRKPGAVSRRFLLKE